MSRADDFQVVVYVFDVPKIIIYKIRSLAEHPLNEFLLDYKLMKS